MMKNENFSKNLFDGIEQVLFDMLISHRQIFESNKLGQELIFDSMDQKYLQTLFENYHTKIKNLRGVCEDCYCQDVEKLVDAEMATMEVETTVRNRSFGRQFSILVAQPGRLVAEGYALVREYLATTNECLKSSGGIIQFDPYRT